PSARCTARSTRWSSSSSVRRPPAPPERPGRGVLDPVRRLPERGLPGQPQFGAPSGDDGLAVAPGVGPGVEVADPYHRVPALVELAGEVGIAAVGQALAVHDQLAPPLAVVVTLPPQVQAGAQGE